jgi:hypothetical protein
MFRLLRFHPVESGSPEAEGRDGSQITGIGRKRGRLEIFWRAAG